MTKNPSKSPKKSLEYITERIKVDKLIPGGQALGTLENGKKIFLWNALPGEIVTKALITKTKSHFVEATAMDIDQSSTHRISPQDPCFLSTSPWQILEYEYELAKKLELLKENFRQQGIELNSQPVWTDYHDLEYRNKMEYSLYYDHDDQKIHLAFHERASHRKIPIQQSSLERPEIFARASAIIEELNSQHADARSYQSLLLRTNQAGEISGGLFENYQPRPIFPQLTDTILGIRYSYSPNGFFQINLPVYEQALRTIQPWIKTTKVLDLYAGVGTIGLSVAKDHQLTLVECDKSAFRELENNCQSATDWNTAPRPILAKSEEALEYVAPDQTVILDPPRAGCDSLLLEKLLEVRPPVIVYLSCNPATQARDVKILTEYYNIKACQPFNFFPRTPHLENLTILEQK